MAKVIVRIEHDSDIENPSDMDCQWKLYSFNRNHASFKHPYYWQEDKGRRLTLAKKLKVGLAFRLGYFEHTQCSWFLSSNPPAGVEFQFDGVEFAGLLVWEHKPSDVGAKTNEARKKDAEKFLECYTAWCNGEGYGYEIQTVRGKDVSSCWGFLGSDSDYMLSEIHDAIKGHIVVKVEGEAAYLWEPPVKKAA